MSAFKPAVIVTDIEGTTSSISFVKDVLFPFARNALADFVERHRNDPDVIACLRGVDDLLGRPVADLAEAISVLRAWIDEDRKATPLKTLQGLIWEQGYCDGLLKGHVYADAAQALALWHQRGIGLYVYSSGSVAAQKLLYGHSDFGDLTSLFSGYFDTTTGPKTESDSYRAIARAIGCAPDRILFLSDSVAELDAADAAGLAVCGLDRGEAIIPSGHAHRFVADFSQILDR